MKAARTHTGDELIVGIRAKNDADERLLGREIVCEADLFPARDETFFRGVRAGVLPPDLSALSFHLIPGENPTPDQVLGYSIELRDGQRSYRRQFNLASLYHVAQRGAHRLMEQKVLNAGDEFAYFISTMRADGDALPEDANGTPHDKNGMKVKRRSDVPVFEN